MKLKSSGGAIPPLPDDHITLEKKENKMRTVNNWVSVNSNSQVASYNNLKFSIVQDENGLYDFTAAIKVGNANFLIQTLDLPTIDSAKTEADKVVFEAFGVQILPLVLPKITQEEQDARNKRSAAIKKYTEASKTHVMLLMSRINCLPPKLQDFIDNEYYIWVPKDPSGKVINSPPLPPKTI
jgi:seryl-tRNA synthetase